MRDLVRFSPAFACLALLAALVQPWALAVAPALVILARALPAPRRPSRLMELAIYAGLGGALVAAVRASDASVPTAIVVVVTVLVIARAFFVPNAAPRGGDVAMIVLACAAQGAIPRPLAPFAATVVLSVVLGVIGRARDPLAPVRGRVPALLALVGLALGAGALGSRALPRATFALARRVTALRLERPRAGFHETLTLGDASEILESDRIVLRLTGDDVDYLRGKVYSVFNGREWIGAIEAAPLSRAEGAGGGRTAHVQAISPRAEYLAPLGFEVRGARPGPDGIARGPRIAAWDVVEGGPVLPGPPSASDLALPRSLGPDLRQLAKTWTEGATTPQARLEAIEAHLREGYQYTLTREPYQGAAIRDFLWGHKAGHCELFATAFALLGRAAGVPTRVVGGYRVIERAAGGGPFIVRDRHAHAWVEAYDGGWRRWDPTPSSAMLRRASATDLFVDKVGAVLDAVTGPRVLGGAVAAVVVLVVVVVEVRRRRARAAALAGVQVHPALLRLEQSLARRELGRAPSEGLLEYAARLERAGEARASGIVLAVAALRYGGQGTDEAVRAAVDAHLAAREAGQNARPTSTRGR